MLLCMLVVEIEWLTVAFNFKLATHRLLVDSLKGELEHLRAMAWQRIVARVVKVRVCGYHGDNLWVIRSKRLPTQTAVLSAENVTRQLHEGVSLVCIAADYDRAELKLISELLN